MHIHFGQAFDGNSSLTITNGLGSCVVGCLGLLNLLETHLGLLSVIASQSERIIQYRHILDKFKDNKFYQASFELDQLGTTSTLLQWRDSWYLHGWLGKFEDENINDIQLRTMAQLETEAINLVSACDGQRLLKISETLRAGVTLPIKKIYCYDSLDSFPKAWRQVLEKLISLNIKIEIVTPKPLAKPERMLGKLQQALHTLDIPADGVTWQNDGSVHIVQSDTPLLAAHWLTNNLDEQYGQRLLVTGGYAALLDDVLSASHLPVQGLSDLSAFRPALQVLPLVLQQLWKPVNIYALLELLTHPVCPITGFARRKLAELIAEKPGINPEKWKEELKSASNIDDDVFNKAWETVKTFLLAERYEHRIGASIERVFDVVANLIQYFHGRLASEKPIERHAFVAAHRQCSVFIRSLEALKSQGITTVSERQLQQLLDQVTSQGSEHGLRVPNVGSMKQVSSPAAAADCHEQVIWWQPVMPILAKNSPWSPTQLETLKKEGVDLPSISQQLKWLADTWLRPILAASKQLTLVLPPDDEEQHPIWLMLKTVCPQIPILKIEQSSLLMQQQGTEIIQLKPLPSLKHWWILQPDTFATVRDKDSYSSLSQQLNNPAQWILNYIAKIRPSQLQQIPDKATLQGNVSHRLIECLFKTHQTEVLSWQESTLKKWYDQTFNMLIDEEAAIFRMAGHYNEGAFLHDRLYQAVKTMLRDFNKAGVIKIDPEYPLSGNFEGGKLAGSADLMLTLATGESVIVDMKWSGEKYYKERLINNRQLQLAMYGEMYRQAGNAFAKPAYFIISNARLLHIHQGVFPSVSALNSQTDEQGPQLWQRFLVTWRWRQAQLRRGEVEVTSQAVADCFVLESSPEHGYVMDKPSDRYNVYKHLMGWSAGA